MSWDCFPIFPATYSCAPNSYGYVVVIYVSRSVMKRSLSISVKWVFSLQDRSPIPRYESTRIVNTNTHDSLKSNGYVAETYWRRPQATCRLFIESYIGPRPGCGPLQLMLSSRELIAIFRRVWLEMRYRVYSSRKRGLSSESR